MSVQNNNSNIVFDADLSSTAGIDDNEQKNSDQEKQSRIIELLKARPGVYHEAVYVNKGMIAKRPLRWSHVPDTFWYYNNEYFNVHRNIFEKQIGKKWQTI